MSLVKASLYDSTMVKKQNTSFEIMQILVQISTLALAGGVM